MTQEVKNLGTMKRKQSTIWRLSTGTLDDPEKAREYGEQYLAVKREFKSKVGGASAVHTRQLLLSDV